jgi:hypothetical protein
MAWVWRRRSNDRGDGEGVILREPGQEDPVPLRDPVGLEEGGSHGYEV